MIMCRSFSQNKYRAEVPGPALGQVCGEQIECSRLCFPVLDFLSSFFTTSFANRSLIPRVLIIFPPFIFSSSSLLLLQRPDLVPGWHLKLAQGVPCVPFPLRHPSHDRQKYFMMFQSRNRCLLKSDIRSRRGKDFLTTVFRGVPVQQVRWVLKGGRVFAGLPWRSFFPPCVYLISWLKHAAGMKEWAMRTEEGEKRERWLCLIHVWLDKHWSGGKHKNGKNAGKRGEMKGRCMRTACRTS